MNADLSIFTLNAFDVVVVCFSNHKYYIVINIEEKKSKFWLEKMKSCEQKRKAQNQYSFQQYRRT